jgi:ABC-type proline/glycine betaine transport system ATPase subunit
MLIESLRISGRIAWSVERNGDVIQSGARDNVITNGGKQSIAALLASGGTFATHIDLARQIRQYPQRTRY